MSFSAEVKSELCALPIHDKGCALAEAYGALLYCNTFSPREIRIVTAGQEFARRLPRLFHRAFGLEFDQNVSGGEKSKSNASLFSDLAEIFNFACRRDSTFPEICVNCSCIFM